MIPFIAMIYIFNANHFLVGSNNVGAYLTASECRTALVHDLSVMKKDYVDQNGQRIIWGVCLNSSPAFAHRKDHNHRR